MKFREYLKKIKACKQAIQWVGDKSLKETWEQCPRGDWMLYLYKNLYPKNLRELTLAKGLCVETVKYLMKDERSIKAVDTAIAFGKGEATLKELIDSTADAYVAARDAAAAADEDETEVQTATVRQGDITISATGAGTVIAADEIELGGELIIPEKAEAIGLVNEIVTEESLEAHAVESVKALALKPVHAMRQILENRSEVVRRRFERSRDAKRAAMMDCWFRQHRDS